MHLALDPVPETDALPPSTEIVVIGGGIVGTSTALFLADKGVPVVLCEKGLIGAEQSGRNWGWVRTMGRDAAEIPLAIESQRIWRALDRMVEGDTGYRTCGILYVADTEAELAAHDAWRDKARDYQLDSKLLDRAGLEAVLPGARRPFAGALYTPSDGRGEPQKAAPAIALGARRRGAAVLTNCAVRGIETAGGRVSGVVTEKGRIACSGVVLAGGAWSRLFCGNLGLDLPALKVLGSAMRTKPLPGGPDVSVGASDFAFRKRLDGGYSIARRGMSESYLSPDHFRLFFDFLPNLIKEWKELRLRIAGRFLEEWRVPRRWALDAPSPFETVRILDPQPNPDLLAEARKNLVAAFPFFAGMEVAHQWGGLIDVTPDAVPVISAVDHFPGFFIASGFSGHGFGIGPGAGRLAADLVTGATPIVDPAPYRLDRFKRSGVGRAA